MSLPGRTEPTYSRIMQSHIARRRGTGPQSRRRAPGLLFAVAMGLAFVSGCVSVPPPDPGSVALTVTVAATDGGSGAVVSSPAGINVTSGSQSAQFNADTFVRLVATPAEGSVFLGFAPADACAAGTSSTTCEFQLMSPTIVEAAFQPAPTVLANLDVVASSPVAGAYFEFTVPSGVVVSAVSPLRAGLSVLAEVVGDTVRLAWVADEARDGHQVRIDFGTHGGFVDPPGLMNALVLASSDGPDLGAATLALEGSSAAVTSATPLIVDPVDHPSDGTLQATFANHPLGDLDGDGSLTVRDALWLLERTSFGGWDDFERYHADLDADYTTDVDDLERLLAKLVDPELPARLHVKPSSVSFVQLDPDTAEDAIVLIANGGRLPLDWVDSVPDGVADSLDGGITGQSAAIRLTLPEAERPGWLPGFYRVEHELDAVDVRVGNLVFLVAGQSNAVGIGNPLEGWPETPRDQVRMLGNDYVWRNASEPLDDATGQLDTVSADPGFFFYSFGTRLGNLLYDNTGFPTYLIPAAKGSSTTTQWLQGGNLDRNQLRGSANYRGQVSAGLQPNPVPQPTPAEGGPVSAVLWYQGESDRSLRASFVANTDTIMDGFAAALGAPTIAVQLATMCRLNDHARLHAVSELQRSLETGSGEPEARPGYHLVVAFDLPRSDCIHLSAFAQRVLAERIELAVREHVLGEAVDGTGPRLVSIQHSGDTVTLRTTHDLEPGVLDAGLFTVWDGAPAGSPDDEAIYAASAIPVLVAERSITDPTAVLLHLAAAVSDPHVRYMAEFSAQPGPESDEPSDPDLWDDVATGVIRAADGGLPLPAFGPLAPFGP